MKDIKPKNILSIDLDYILSPCINLYNDLVIANETPEKIWEKIETLRNIDKHISYDDENLRYVFNIFTHAISLLKNKKNVKFALNHDAILFDLASSKYEKDTFCLYNIDHHHDIFYSPDAKKDVDIFNVSTVANWVWYLDKHHKINQYNWICNTNSFFPETEVKSFGKMDAFTKDKIKHIFDVKEWDYIFVCNSPHWFPKKYEIFFYMLIDIYENFTKEKVEVDKNIFSPNGLSRPYPYDKK
jgi:hypothetical protein